MKDQWGKPCPAKIANDDKASKKDDKDDGIIDKSTNKIFGICAF